MSSKVLELQSDINHMERSRQRTENKERAGDGPRSGSVTGPPAETLYPGLQNGENRMGPTSSEYNALEYAYNYFNRVLFGGELPGCLITLQRVSRSYGYFRKKKFSGRLDGRVTDEIALNPDTFEGMSDIGILSNLGHVMSHLWQSHFGKPSRNGYHNEEWASKMEEIGVHPSDTGYPGGKRTGQKMNHYIENGGRFERAARELIESGFRVVWQSTSPSRCREASKKSDIKYSCRICGLKAEAKPGVKFYCGECKRKPLMREDGRSSVS